MHWLSHSLQHVRILLLKRNLAACDRDVSIVVVHSGMSSALRSVSMDIDMLSLLNLMLVEWRSSNRIISSPVILALRYGIVTWLYKRIWMISLTIHMRSLDRIISHIVALRPVRYSIAFRGGNDRSRVVNFRLIVLSLNSKLTVSCKFDRRFLLVIWHWRFFIKDIIRDLIDIYLLNFWFRCELLWSVFGEWPIEYFVSRLSILSHKNGLNCIHLLLLPIDDFSEFIHHNGNVKDFCLDKSIAEHDFSFDMRLKLFKVFSVNSEVF